MTRKVSFLLPFLIFAMGTGAAYSDYASEDYVDEQFADVVGYVDIQDRSIRSKMKTDNDQLFANLVLLRDMLNARDADKNWIKLDTEAQLAIPAINELKAALDAKANADEVLTADSLTTLNEAITALQTGKANASTVTDIQTAIDNLGDTYATDAEVNTAIANIQSAIDNMDLSAYAKTADLAAVAISGQYADLQGKPEIPSIAGLATEQALTDLQTALEAEIAKKQAAGEYLVAADLNVLNNQVAALQSGKADVATVAEIQTTISKLGDTYATDAEVSAAIDAVKALIPTMPTKVSELSNDVGYITDSALSGYAKTADVELVDNKLVSATAEEIDAMSSEDKARKYPSIAVSQTIANAAVTKVNQVAGDLSTLQTQVSTNTADIKEIQDAGYQTADDVKVALQAAKDYADANDADTVYDDTAVRGLISGNAENIAKNAAAIATNTGDIANIKAANYQNADQVQGAITKATADMVTDSELAAKGFVAGIKTSGSYLVNFDADGNVSYAAVQIIGKDSQPIDLTEGEIK